MAAPLPAGSVERGIPPHLTILFPFVPEHEIGDEILTALERLYALVPPFDYALESVESFPDAAWLAPAPAEPFLDLIARTRSVSRPAAVRKSRARPRPTARSAPTTTADDDPAGVEAMVRELRSGLGTQPPIRCHAREVSLLCEGVRTVVVRARRLPARRSPMSGLIRIAVRARGDEAEPVRARLLQLAPAGLEGGTPTARSSSRSTSPGGGGCRPRGAPRGRRSSPSRTAGRTPGAHFTSRSCGGLWLGPPWERPPDPSRAVVIDPGRAFGTGSHPTTRLCVELLARTPRGSLLVGCGSGVLAIAASRLGFAPVLAIDVDPVAVETTRANAAANGVERDARVVDALSGRLPAADVAVANVLLAPVEAILARLNASEAITSGYLAGERPAHRGWAHLETMEVDGWAADRFRR